MKIRSNKGVTIVILVITIIVMLILTGIIVSTARNQFSVSNINNLNSDIETISTKVSDYYLKNNKLPIFKSIEKTQSDVQNNGESKPEIIKNEENIIYATDKNKLIEIFEKNVTENINEEIKREIEKQINPNDEGAYYVINLSLLENLTLNYGREYNKWISVKGARSEIYQDLYIINSVSHQIYYPKGIKTVDKEYYFTKIDDTNEVVTEISFNRDIFNISIKSGIMENGIERYFVDQSATGNGENNEDIANNQNFITKYTINANTSEYEIAKAEYGWSEYRDVKYKDNVTFYNIEGNENGKPVIKINNADIEKNKYLWVKITDNYGSEHIKIVADSVIVTGVRTTLYPEDTTKKIISAEISITDTSSEYHYTKKEYCWSEYADISKKLKVNFTSFEVNSTGSVTIDTKPISDAVDCYLWIKLIDNYGEEHISIKNIQ